MKKKIAVLALAFILLPFEGQASISEIKTELASAKYNPQDIRLPGAPSGGYRGDYRFKVRGKSKRSARKKTANRRARSVKRTRARY